jgi:hypothetical protein
VHTSRSKFKLESILHLIRIGVPLHKVPSLWKDNCKFGTRLNSGDVVMASPPTVQWQKLNRCVNAKMVFALTFTNASDSVDDRWAAMSPTCQAQHDLITPFKLYYQEHKEQLRNDNPEKMTRSFCCKMDLATGN